MRILHTADWHLGKTLENRSRLEEQAHFLEELCALADEHRIDLVVVAGDVYDSINPPAAAEKLFYQSMKKLSAGGARPMLVIAGNHDSPERLTAASPLATELGIVLLGTPKSVADTGDYGGYSVVDAGEGYVELKIGGESLVALTLPYPSEKRLNEIFMPVGTEAEAEPQSLGRSYSDKVDAFLKGLEHKYRRDTINICVGHFYVRGGLTSDSERDIQVGGLFAVDTAVLPEAAQYIALGHLHRPQQTGSRIYYSGSPIQYGTSETGYAKCVYIAELHPGVEAQVTKIYLRNYKPIEIWEADGVEEATALCEARGDDHCWVFLRVKTDRPLLQSEIRGLKLAKKDILEIRPIMPREEGTEAPLPSFSERSLLSEFTDYYQTVRGAPPGDGLVELFLSLCGEEEETDHETG